MSGRIPRVITHEEEVVLLQHLKRNSIRNYTLALFGLKMGLRAGEIIALDVSDVFHAGQVFHEIEIRSATTKTKKPRWGYIAPELHLALDQLIKKKRSNGQSLNPQDPLFCSSWANKRLGIRRLQQIIRSAAENTLGCRLKPHDLRHTFATNMMRKANARVVQELLGHASIKTTQLYTHPNRQDLKQAYETL
ncbi:Tyrosine recombinase XerC [subsurface metagenome]